MSEAPEAEIPVARKLVDYILLRQEHPYIPGLEAPEFDYLSPLRRQTKAVRNIGGEHVPVVIADRMDGKTEVNPQFTPDYIYAGRALPEQRETGVEYPRCRCVGGRIRNMACLQSRTTAVNGRLQCRT